MKYMLTVVGANASDLLNSEIPIASDDPNIKCYKSISIKRRSGKEDVLLMESDSRSSFQKEIIPILSFLERDRVRHENPLYLTIAIFANEEDFNNSMVLPEDVLAEILRLGLSL